MLSLEIFKEYSTLREEKLGKFSREVLKRQSGFHHYLAYSYEEINLLKP